MIFLKNCAGNEIIQRNMKYDRHCNEYIQAWCSAALFIHTFCTWADVQNLSQLQLAESVCFSKRSNSVVHICNLLLWWCKHNIGMLRSMAKGVVF